MDPLRGCYRRLRGSGRGSRPKLLTLADAQVAGILRFAIVLLRQVRAICWNSQWSQSVHMCTHTRVCMHRFGHAYTCMCPHASACKCAYVQCLHGPKHVMSAGACAGAGAHVHVHMPFRHLQHAQVHVHVQVLVSHDVASAAMQTHIHLCISAYACADAHIHISKHAYVHIHAHARPCTCTHPCL